MNKLKWWMFKQRVKLWISERVIEISREIEQRSKPKIEDLLPLEMRSSPIKIIHANLGEVLVEDIKRGNQHHLVEGQVLQLQWKIEKSSKGE